MFFLIALMGLLVMASPFVILSRRPRSKGAGWLVVAAPMAWGLAMLWELVARLQGWEIRVDLLLIVPLLIGVSLAAGGAWLLAREQKGCACEEAGPNRIEAVMPREDGVRFRQGNRAEGEFRWSEVIEVRAFMLDLWERDQFCLGFALADGRDLVVDEEAEGFERLSDALAERLPGLKSDWKQGLLGRPFASQEMVIWRRGMKR